MRERYIWQLASVDLDYHYPRPKILRLRNFSGNNYLIAVKSIYLVCGGGLPFIQHSSSSDDASKIQVWKFEFKLDALSKRILELSVFSDTNTSPVCTNNPILKHEGQSLTLKNLDLK